MVVYLVHNPPISRRKFAMGTGSLPPTDKGDRTAGDFAEAQISTNTCTAFSQKSTTLSPLVTSLARSNQSRLDSHGTMATPTSCRNNRDPPHANTLLLGHSQIWEHPVSLFDDGLANGIFAMQDYGLDIDLPQSQLAHSLLHLPPIDRGAYQESPFPSNNQAPISVSIISPMYPHSV